MYYKNPLSRFVFRKNLFRRIKMRLDSHKRKATKDEFKDMHFILKHHNVQTIIDAGANIGFITFLFRKLFPSATVYSFEPNPRVHERLCSSYAHDSKVIPFQMGIAEAKGTLSFNVNVNSGVSSFLRPTAYHRLHHARNQSLAPITVETVSIDDFAIEKGLESIDILKLDIEGYELNALRGASRMLDDQRIMLIYSEVHVVPSYHKQPLLHDLISFLHEKRYYLYNLYDWGETPIRQATTGNAIFISEALRENLLKTYGENACGWTSSDNGT